MLEHPKTYHYLLGNNMEDKYNGQSAGNRFRTWLVSRSN